MNEEAKAKIRQYLSLMKEVKSIEGELQKEFGSDIGTLIEGVKQVFYAHNTSKETQPRKRRRHKGRYYPYIKLTSKVAQCDLCAKQMAHSSVGKHFKKTHGWKGLFTRKKPQPLELPSFEGEEQYMGQITS